MRRVTVPSVRDPDPSDPDRDDRKTATPGEREPKPAIERHQDGSVTIGSYALAEQVLKSRATEQAGFNAALVRRLPQKNVSVLFCEGEEHRRQRGAVARFFTPAAVATRYRTIMEEVSARLVDALRREGRDRLDTMTLELSVGVAAAIVGLTDSIRPGLSRRLSRILDVQSQTKAGWLGAAWYVARVQGTLLKIYLADVRPAIRARRTERRPDLISSLLDQGWSPLDILTESITYATAGISTTREFIVAAALHLVEDGALRARFLAGDDDGRVAILGEILRLEPAVSTLLRRTTAPLRLTHGDVAVDLPAGQAVAIDVRRVNADPAVAGACPFRLDPDRTVRGPADVASFGDGHHRCPGAFVALHEAAIFLDRLLRLPNLRIESGPNTSRHSVSTGYVLRDVVVTTSG